MAAAFAEKELRWIGSSYIDLSAFPKAVRREAGFQLGRIQAGIDPTDWKPFEAAGSGTREIRIRGAAGSFRVMYVARFPEAVYVLHCFQKKTQATSRQDRHIVAVRYRAVERTREGTP